VSQIPNAALPSEDHGLPGPTVIACEGCGAQYALGELAPGLTASCRRCGGVVLKLPIDSLERSLALTVTGLVLLFIAATMPFMSMGIQGRVQEVDLITGALVLGEEGFWALALCVAVLMLLAPAIKLGGLFYVLGGLRLRHPPPSLPLVFRWLVHLRPWSMIEVYLLGVFVAYVKLIEMATVELGPAFYALALLMLVMVAIDLTLSSELVWQEMERRGLVNAPVRDGVGPLIQCHVCGLVSAAATEGAPCPRCGAARHRRKPNSISRAWALTAAALILYFPANLFPVMTVISFGTGAPDTILSGVQHLIEAGMWPIALLVFFASITVPVLKLTGLAFLLIATQRRSRWRLRDRTLLYRIVETVGRWSMIDIFMISILAGLVRLGSVATIEPGIGAVPFAAVVITTMFAATAFDPRLMWDAAGDGR
jgi:paraquat-inducible protein A